MSHENQDHLIHQILATGGPYDDLLHRPLLEATRRIGQGAPVSASLRIQVLDEVMELWREDPFNPIQEVINEIFSGISNLEFAEEVSTRLLSCVTRESFGSCVGVELARIAGLLGKKKEATAYLLEQVAEEIQDPGHEDYAVEAVVALGQIGEKEKAAFMLLGMLKDLQDTLTINHAIESIIQFDAQSKKVLLNLARDVKTSVHLKVAIARSLVKVNESQQLIPILHEIAFHQDGEDAVRRRAARGVGEASEPELAASVLIEIFKDSRTHKAVACHAAEDLMRFGVREIGKQFLVDAAQPGTPCVICDSITCGCGREFIVEKLIKLDEQEKAAFLLISALQDMRLSPSSRIGHVAILARLGKIQEALPILIKAVRSLKPSDYAYSKALETLGKCGTRDEVVLNVLLSVAQDESIKWNERWRAIEALGNYGDASHRVMDFLATMARNNPGSPFSRTACAALWKLTENSNTHPELNTC